MRVVFPMADSTCVRADSSNDGPYGQKGGQHHLDRDNLIDERHIPDQTQLEDVHTDLRVLNIPQRSFEQFDQVGMTVFDIPVEGMRRGSFCHRITACSQKE
jgi:hypothetical protein